MRRTRALMIVQQKLTSGKTDADLAKDFHISTTTLKRSLTLARNEGLIQKFEDSLLSNLVPTALAACQAAMESGDAQTAIEILKGTGLLKKQVVHNSAPSGDGDTLEGWFKIRRDRLAPNHQAGVPAIGAGDSQNQPPELDQNPAEGVGETTGETGLPLDAFLDGECVDE